VPDQWSRAGSPIVEELQRITGEIDDLTKAVLDTITLGDGVKGPASAPRPSPLARISHHGS